MDLQINGILGLIILGLANWAILNIAQARVSNERKVLWIPLVLILPLVGFLIWFLAGPRSR